MLKPKIKLTDNIRAFILTERKRSGKTAETVSESIGRAKSWLSQIENGRLQNIGRVDFINLIASLLQISEDDAEKYIEVMIMNPTKKTVEKKTNADGLEIYKVNDESDMEILRMQYGDVRSNILMCLDYFFENVSDKKEGLNLLGNFACNLNADLGFMLSVAALKWDRMEKSDISTKQMLCQEINSLLNKYGTTSELDKYISARLSNDDTDN